VFWCRGEERMRCAYVCMLICGFLFGDEEAKCTSPSAGQHTKGVVMKHTQVAACHVAKYETFSPTLGRRAERRESLQRTPQGTFCRV
jgi:hypothetical protein